MKKLEIVFIILFVYSIIITCMYIAELNWRMQIESVSTQRITELREELDVTFGLNKRLANDCNKQVDRILNHSNTCADATWNLGKQIDRCLKLVCDQRKFINKQQEILIIVHKEVQRVMKERGLELPVEE